eukprot:TRINITY_DN7160_c0_g1_i1.p1 TRINITY_DN7160_c0_g1~~TRINITY_DN7160_c0_g1_i1.p1  ORF type:complete len:193 (-),score=12.08 TRINITY_DN7160_c0_g1_i1:367-945(-)
MNTFSDWWTSQHKPSITYYYQSIIHLTLCSVMEEAAAKRKVINFYHITDSYGEFSNFYAASIIIDDKEWPTTEHYFQAQKFVGSELEEFVRKQPTPGEAARVGRTRQMNRTDWEEAKDDVMLRCCKEKFRQHPGLRKLLLSTGDAKLVEHTKKDRYWGDGGDGSGRNQLGKTLMLIRDELNKEAVDSVSSIQ